VFSHIQDLIANFLQGHGLELVDLNFRYEGRDIFLRVLVDKPQGGITLDECAQLNSSIGHILDEKGIIEQRYILEVSSPGLDRPLINEADFLRCRGKAVRFFLRTSLYGKTECVGVIQEVTEDAVEIEAEGERLRLPIIEIAKAKQIIDII
jgi:ribosome maturation factor RimP